MKKVAIILVLALGFSVSNLNASNDILTSTDIDEIAYTAEVNALCRAVATGNMAEVKRLIKAGADVNEKSNGMQPIHYAARYNRVDMIKVLITAGSRIHDPCDKGYTAQAHAKKTNAVEAENFLKRFKRKTV